MVKGQEDFESKEQYDRRRLMGQIKVYLLTYLGYSMIHFQREFWSLGKSFVSQRHPELSKSVLSTFDFSEMAAYGLFLYVCGTAGDRFDPRKILTMAFVGIGFFYALLSLGGFLNITSQAYFFPVFIGIGVFNSFIFPSCIAILGQWFPKKSRGLFIGTWASCNNFGNMIGIQIGAALFDVYGDKWEALQAYAAGFVFIWAILIFFFLVPHPEMVGIQIEELTEKEALVASATEDEVYNNIIKQKSGSISSPAEIAKEVRMTQTYRRLSSNGGDNVPLNTDKRITFWRAWLLPGVMLYGFSFFCTKMAVYCLLFRLPTFFKDQFGYDSHQIANVSNLLDFGALIGSVVIGASSDLTHGRRSPSACVAVILAMIVTFSFVIVGPDYGNMPIGLLLVMMFMLGFCINGLNNVISSACSADLGKQEALKDNSRAIATVTGIIDGTGTMGAAVGQLIISFTQQGSEWRYGYFLVVAIDISITIIPVAIILTREVKELVRIKTARKAMGLGLKTE